MKWIKNRNKFISEEAKLRDVILPAQKDVVSRTWGEKFLDYEEIEATDNIKQGKWKLSEEDKIEVLGQFFQADLNSIYKSFNSLPDKFQEVFNKSIDISLIREDKDKFEKILNNFDIKKPSINQIGVLTDPVFRKISVSETLASEVIVRDENGRPIMGEDGRPQKVGKEPGEVIYSKNLTNINGFVDDFNRCFPDSKIDSSLFSSGSINQLISSSKEDFGGDRYSVEVDLYSRDMFLSIKHNASVPAFIIFDTPIYNNKEQLIAEQLPLCRMMIRNVESFDENKSSESQIFFDRAYPDRMQKIFSKIITKYSGNIENYSEGSYLFTPDVSLDDTLREPYMDRLGVQRGYYIGVNAKKVNFNYSHDWSRTKISPKAKIEEIIIETPNLPENFFEIPITPNWMKFKFIKINNLEPFKRIITESIAFEKCKINSQAIDDLMKFNDVLKKIQFTACEIKDIDLSKFKHLKEIQFIYSLDTDQLQQTLKGANFDKLVISSDLLSDNENKEFIKELKKQKKIVEIIGPVI